MWFKSQQPTTCTDVDHLCTVMCNLRWPCNDGKKFRVTLYFLLPRHNQNFNVFELVEITLSVFYGFECQRNKAFLIQPSRPSRDSLEPKTKQIFDGSFRFGFFLYFKIKLDLATLSTLFTFIVNPVLPYNNFVQICQDLCFLKKPSQDFKKYFCFGCVWIP